MNSKNWRLRSCKNSSVKLSSNYSPGLLEFAKHKWQISMFVARTITSREVLKLPHFSRPIMILLDTGLILCFFSIIYGQLKQKQIWKTRMITKIISNELKNSQPNLRPSAFFNVVVFPQHEKKSITADLSYFSRTFWENIWKVAYGNDCLRSRNSKEKSALKFCISSTTILILVAL